MRANVVDIWLMVLMALFWAGAFVVGKVAVSSVPPEMVAFVRFAIAGVVLLGLSAWKERQNLRLARKDWLLVLGLGATGIAGYNLLFFRGLLYAKASDGGMIIPTLNPLLMLFAAAIFLKEPLTQRKLVGAAISVAGQVLIFWTLLHAASGDVVRLRGDLFYVAASFCWVAYGVLGRIASRRFTPLASTTWASLSGVLFMVPFALWTGPGSSGYTLGFWADGLYLALGATVGGFLLWSYGIARLGASRTSVFMNLVPVFTLALAALFLQERPGWLQLAGMLVVLGGVYLTASTPAPAARIAKGESA